MIIDYLDLYNKVIEEPTTSKNVKRKTKLHEWALNEDRRKEKYNVADITLFDF